MSNPQLPATHYSLRTRKYISLAEAAKGTPYSQEYLSLLARHGKLFAKKIGRNWYTTEEAIKEYTRAHADWTRQNPALSEKELGLGGQDENLRPVVAEAFFHPVRGRPAEGTATTASGRSASNGVHSKADEDAEMGSSSTTSDDSEVVLGKQHEARAKFLEEFERLNVTPEARKETEAQKESAVSIRVVPPPALSPAAPMFGSSTSKHVSEKEVEPLLRGSTSKLEDALEKISESLGTLSQLQRAQLEAQAQQSRLMKSIEDPRFRVAESGQIVQPQVVKQQVVRELEPKQKEFFEIESQSLGHRLRRLNYFGRNVMRGPRSFAIIVSAFVLLFLLAGGFSFGNVDQMTLRVRDFFKDADTIQGHFAGTHANEVLILDKEGNVSIYGHIETEGQLRSRAPDGVAPIVVDSMTLVENLNAEYFDGLASKDFTLAFVTKNGNITYDDVYLEGNVEVGKTLTVKGATKLLDQLLVYGKLGVFGEAVFGKDVKLTSGNLQLDKGSVNVSQGNINVSSGNVSIAQGNLQLGRGTIEINNDAMIKNLNSEFLQGKVPSDFTLDFVVENGDETDRLAFFHGGVYGSDGIFGTLGVAGDVSIGTEDNDKNTVTIFSKKFDLDKAGNVSASGKASVGGLSVSGNVFSNLIPSGSFDLGSSTNRWDDVFANRGDFSEATVASLSVGNLIASGSSNLGGTSSASFRINTDNISSDSEDAYLAFERGAITPNATLKWNSTANRFEFNQPVRIASTSTTLFSVSGGAASISNTLFVQSGGNVGIGTTNPTTKLDVIGNASVSGNFEVSGTLTAGSITLNNSSISGNLEVGGTASASKFYADAGTAASPSFSFRADQDTGMFRPAVNELGFSTLGLERIRVDANGNVGVATTAPIAPLHVVGQCVTGDTRLRRRRKRRGLTQTERGQTRTIDNSEYEYDEVAIKNIQPGDEILTLDEKTGKLIYQRINALMDMGVKPIYKLTTASGKTIRTTGNHPYLVRMTEADQPNEASTGLPCFAEATQGERPWSSAKADKKPRLGIFYDNSNMFYAQKEAGWKIDFGKLRQQLADAFDIKFINFYTALPAENDPARKDTLGFLELVKPHVYLKTKLLKYIRTADGIEKKGDMDVDIALDLTETINELDAVLVVSGDSDLLPLRHYVIKHGKKIAFAGFRRNMAWELTKFGKYLYLDGYRSSASVNSRYQKTNSEPELGVTLLFLLYSRAPSLSSGGMWIKVKDLREGQKIAVFKGGKAAWDTIAKIENLPPEQVYDIEVEGTHNFIGNDIIAHNTYITGNLGVGASSPEQKLEVGGNIFASASANVDLTLQSLVSGAGTDGKFTIRASGVAGVDQLRILNGAGTNLVTIASLGNVGVGTTSPLTKLEVQGTASASNLLTIGGLQVAGGASVGYSRFGTNTTSYSGSLSATNDVLISGDLEVDGRAFFDTHASVANNFEVGSNVFYVNQSTGNVGIGTQTLTQALEVVGNASLSGDIQINGNDILDSSSEARLTFTAGTLTLINENASVSANFEVGSSDLFVSTAGIGVNTSNLSEALEVVGVASISSELNLYGGLEVAKGAAGDVPYSRFGIDTTSHPGSITASNDLLISGDLEVNGSIAFDGFLLAGDVRFTNASVSGNLETATLKVDTISRDSSGVITISNNVSASQNFEISGYVSASKTFGSGLSDCDAFTSKLTWDTTTGKFICSIDVGAGSGATLAIRESDSTFSNRSSLSFDAAHFTVSYPATTEALIKLDWGAGGPASLSQNEVVTGIWDFQAGASISPRLEIYNTVATASLEIISANVADKRFFIRSNNTGAGTSDRLSIINNAGTELVSIASPGNIGIGTTSPLTKLEVQGTASASNLLTIGGLQVAGGASVGYSRFGTAATTHSANISATNDVLISGDLEVDGSVFFDGTVNFVGIASSDFFYAGNGTAASPSFSFRVDQDTGMFRPAVNQLGFSTLGIERVRIGDGGNVGIGTAILTEKLEVVGNASLSGDLQVNGNDILSSNAEIVISISNDDASVVGCLNVGSATECTSQGNIEASGVLDINGGGTSDIAGTLNLSGNTLTATTDLTLNPTGGQVLFADGDTLAIGGVAGQNYNILSDSTLTSRGLISDNDLFIEGNLEVDSDTWFDANASVSGNLEVTGTTIIGNNLTVTNASISNNLEVGGVIKAADGTALLPSYTFENDTNTGLYRVGTDTVGVTSGGVHAASISAGIVEATTFKGATYTGDGAVSINTGSGDLTIDANSNNVIISANASVSNNFEVGTNDLYVNATGIGINTQTLTEALEVVGNASLSGDLQINGSDILDSTAAIRITLGTGFVDFNDDIEVSGNDIRDSTQTNRVTFTSTGTTGLITLTGDVDSTKHLKAGDELIVTNAAQFAGTATQAYSRFGTATTTHSGSIDASNDLLISGSLEVDGSAYFDGTVNFGGVASAANFYADAGTAASPSFSFKIDQDTGMFRPAINQLGFSTLGVERIRITDVGNIGIGTTTPLTQLEVQGTASASNLLTIGGLQVAGGASVGYSRFGTGTTSHTAQGFTSATNSLFITGNLEVDSDAWFDGNASVSKNLEVDGVISGFSIANNSSVSNNLEVGGVIKASDGTALAPSYTFENDTNTGFFRPGIDIVGFTTGGTERMRLDASGNLGIGATTPEQKLEVGGNIFASASANVDLILQSLVSGAGTDGKFTIRASGAAGVDQLRILNGVGTNLVTIASLGNVGIGTTSPLTKLEVQGTASASNLLTIGGLQVAGGSSVSYSRFGTAATGYSGDLTATNDLLISGDLEVDGRLFLDGNASSTANFEITGYSSASKRFGSGLTDCDNPTSSKLLWSDTGLFSCGTDQSGGGGGSTLEVREFPGGTSVIGVATISFAAPHFAVSSSGSVDVGVRLDWGAGGPASLSQDETATGFWNFTAASTQLAGLELKEGFASISMLNSDFRINLKGTGDFVVQDAGSNVFVVTDTDSITLNDAVTDTLTVNGSASVSANFELTGVNSRLGINAGGATTVALEVGGTASISSELNVFGGLEVAKGVAGDVAYSRFGENTTNRGLSTADDVLISGNLEVDSDVWIDANASVSGNFEVTGTTIIGSNLTITNASISNNLEVGGVIKAADGTAALPSYTFENDTNTGFFRPDTDIIGFTTGGTERMRLDASGNLGIGATTVEQKFVVGGNVLASNSANVDLILNSFTPASPSLTDGKFTIRASGAAGVDQLRILNGAGTNLVTIASLGNVGIGTTTVSQKLVVQGTAGANDIFNVASASGTSILYVTKGGNVGIGTTGPSGQLHVNRATGQVNQYLTSGDNGGAIIRIERYNSDGNYFTIETGSGNRDTIEINPSIGTGLVMTTSGNVGIGTTAPLTKLEVQGTASASNLLTIGGLQVAGGASVGYSRFGTAATSYSTILSATNDLLISGDLEVDARAFFDTHASVANNFEVGSNVFYVNQSTGNVGIGTQTLTQALEVVGNASLSGDIQINGDDILSSAALVALSISNDDASVVGCLNVGSATECTSQGNIEASGVLDINGGGTSDIAGTLNLSGNTLTATTDLTLNPTGGQVLFADGDTLAIGGVAGQNYNILSDSTLTSRGLISDNDLFIEGNLEVDSDTWFDANASVSGNLEVVGTITGGNLISPGASFSDTVEITTNGTVDDQLKLTDSFTDPDRTFSLRVNDGDFQIVDGATTRLHIASASGFVGIGTTSPLTKLEVQGTASASNLLTIGGLQVAGGASVAYSRFGTAATSYSTLLSGANDVLISGDLEVDARAFFDTHASVANNFEVGSNVFYVNQSTGNVGIGTQTLTQALEVVGNASLSGDIQINGNDILDSSSEARLTFTAGTLTLINENASVSANFEVGSSDLFVSTAGIGVNTSNLSEALEVVGVASISSELNLYGGLEVAKGAAGDVAYSRFGIDTTTHAGSIAASNDLLISGDLEVNGSVAFDGGFLMSVASVSGNLEVGGVIKASDGTALLPSYTFENDTNTGFFRPGTDIIGFTTGGTERMRLDASGNLGIGASTPEQKLNVGGNILASASDDVEFTLNSFTVASPSLTDGKFTIRASGAAGVDQLRILNGAGTNLVTIASSGNVGIGTTGPLKKLHVGAGGDTPVVTADGVVVQNAGSTALIVRDAANNVETFIQSDSTGGILGTVTSHDLTLRAGNTDRITINQVTGNVGIGTTTPLTKLEVQGTASASNLLTIGGLQVAGGASVAYSRFGTATTTHAGSISAADDLLISGDLEVNGSIAFDGFLLAGDVRFSNASVSNNLEVGGVIKASDGTALLPSYTFENDTNTGLYRVGTDTVGITSNGTHAASISAATIESTTFKGTTYTGDGAVSLLSGGTSNITITPAGNILTVNDVATDLVDITGRASVSATTETVTLKVTTISKDSGQITVSNDTSFSTNASVSGIFEVGSANDLYVNATGIGVNTNNLSEALEVVGNASISGDLRVNGNDIQDSAGTARLTFTTSGSTGLLNITGNASVSVNFEVIGYVSASATYGSALSDCDNSTQKLAWTASGSNAGKFSCKTDNSGTPASNSLDFDEFVASMSLDTNTSVDFGAFNLSFNLNSTGDFQIKDNGTTFATFNDSGQFILDNIRLDGNTIDTTTGELTIGTGTGDVKIELTSLNDVLEASKSLSSIAANYTLSDFTFNRNIDATGFNLSGDVLKIVDVSSTSAAATNTASLVHANSNPTLGTFTGNLLRLSTGATPTNRFVVDYAGRTAIGSGVATINQQLEVAGTASLSEELITGGVINIANGGVATVAYNRFGTTTAGNALVAASNDVFIGGDLEVDGLAIFDGGASISAGNFEVVGAFASASRFYAGPGTASSPSFSFGSDQDTGMFRPAVNSLGFSTLGLQRLTINSSGNVGIGTSNLDGQFEIVSAATSTNVASISANSLNTGSGIILQANGLTSGFGINVRSTGATTGALLNLMNNTMTTGSLASMSANALTTGNGFFLQANGLTTGNAMQLISTGTIITPGTLLELRANSLTTGAVASLSAGALSTGSALNITAGGATALTSGSGILVTGPTGAAAITKGLVRITAAGAYTGTGGLLTVNSATVTGAVASISDSAVMTTTGSLLSLTADAATTTTGLFSLSANGLTTGNAMQIVSSGTIITPGSLLELRANSLTTGAVASLSAGGLTSGDGLLVTTTATGLTGDLVELESRGSNAGITGNVLKVGIIGATGTGVPLNVTNAGTGLTLRINDDGTYTDSTPFSIDSAGNVGIGETTPNEKLTVAGNILASTSGDVDLIIKSTSATGDEGLFRIRSATTNDRLDILNQSTVLVTISSLGHLGINDVTPTAVLEISGNSSNFEVGEENVNGKFVQFIRLRGAGNNEPGIKFANESSEGGEDYDFLLSNIDGAKLKLLSSTSNANGFEMDGGGNARFAFLNSGTIDTRLEVNGTASVSGGLYLGLTTSTNNFALCHENNGAQGTGELVKDCSGTPGADYQEMYPSSADIEVGDIVVPSSLSFAISSSTSGSLAGKGVPYMQKSSYPYQPNVLGVASNPQDSGDFNTIGNNSIPIPDRPFPLALNGRVVVKVNLENGPIRVGDLITTSSMSGVGMKTTKAGRVVGMALDNFDGTNCGTSQVQGTCDVGKILVFVNPHWYGGNLAGDGSTAGTTTVNGDAEIFKYLNIAASGSQVVIEHGAGFDSLRLRAVKEIIFDAPVAIFRNIWAKGDVIAEGIKKTYYEVAKFKSLKFKDVDVGLMFSNWGTRTIEIAGEASDETRSLFSGSGAQAADQSKVDLAENGAYLATYGVDSTRGEIQLSGTSDLVFGEAKVYFDYSFTELIASSSPIRVLVTPTTRINGQLYVETKTPYGFVVRELNSADNAKFDWLVIARRRGYDDEPRTNADLTLTDADSTFKDLNIQSLNTVSSSDVAPTSDVGGTASGSAEPSPTPSSEPVVSESPTPLEPASSPSPSESPTPEPTPSESPSPTPEPTPTPTPEPTPSPSESPTPELPIL